MTRPIARALLFPLAMAALLVGIYTAAMHAPTPHHLNITIAGPTAQTEPLPTSLRGALGDTYDVSTVTSMGKTFQWMNQTQVLADLDTLIRPGGGIALVSTGPRNSTVRPAWLDIIESVCTDVIGPGYRQEHGPVAHPAEGRDEALLRSAFSRIETARWDQTFTRTLDELIGLQYSFSYSSPAVLGTRQAAFEELLRRELTAFSPNGTFENTVPIEAVIATRPQLPARSRHSHARRQPSTRALTMSENDIAQGVLKPRIGLTTLRPAKMLLRDFTQ
ncbi:class I SAM-dependent methyltransferase [Streptomyces goshikiensis]|uniref:class I SAM-dependent methyltransferase n=1 Tax=Streptomyces goshikiensis TaxID=1942 RepID=UPI0036C9B5C2